MQPTDHTHLINTTAYRVYRRYRRWAEAADIRQEMWAYLWSLPEATLVELTPTNLRWRLHDAGVRYARREKATQSGYHPDDEAYYTVRVIREMLPVVLDDEPAVLRGVDEASKSAIKRAGTSPGMDYETAVADLRRAYKGLPADRQVVLRDYVEGWGDVEESAVVLALRNMQRCLGGRRPGGAS